MPGLLHCPPMDGLSRGAPSQPLLPPPLPGPRSKQHDFGSDIIPGAKDLGYKVQAHLFKGYWVSCKLLK